MSLLATMTDHLWRKMYLTIWKILLDLKFACTKEILRWEILFQQILMLLSNTVDGWLWSYPGISDLGNFAIQFPSVAWPRILLQFDTGLLHHFHFNLRRLYGWDILWILIFTCVSTDWHISHVFMVHTESSIFVSDVLTHYAHWLVPTLKIITLYIWLPKTELMPICFCFNFFICGCE